MGKQVDQARKAVRLRKRAKARGTGGTKVKESASRMKFRTRSQTKKGTAQKVPIPPGCGSKLGFGRWCRATARGRHGGRKSCPPPTPPRASSRTPRRTRATLAPSRTAQDAKRKKEDPQRTGEIERGEMSTNKLREKERTSRYEEYYYDHTEMLPGKKGTSPITSSSLITLRRHSS